MLLGDADIDLRYDGNRRVLTFDRAQLRRRRRTPRAHRHDRLPRQRSGPRFDIAVDANGYPAQRAIDAVDLDLKIGDGPGHRKADRDRHAGERHASRSRV